MKIRIFGIQRSGTNYLEQLLNEHTQLEATPGNPASGYWKHTAFPERRFLFAEDIHFVIVKNPFKWLESLHRYNADLTWRSGVYHQNLFNNEEIRKNSAYLIHDARNHPTALEGAVRLYNTFYRNWIDFLDNQKELRIHLFRYEDILRNQTGFVNGVQKKFQQFYIRKRTISMGTVRQSDDFSHDRRKDYLDQKNVKILSAEALKMSLGQFDLDLLSTRLRYPIPSSEER